MTEQPLRADPLNETATDVADQFALVTETVTRLVGSAGCAWHQEQTHASLTQYLIEETAELVEAIDHQLSRDEMVSELADVLYQVLFHSAIAERDGEGYGPAAVAAYLDDKLRARHPHVFGDRGPMTVEELNAEWEQLKEDANQQPRGSRGVLEGIPVAMPTLARAAKMVNRLQRAGVWDAPETSGSPAGDAAASVAEREAHIGNELLTVVARAVAQGVDPDRALRVQLSRHAATLTGAHTAANMEE